MADARAHPAPARLPTLTEVMQEGQRAARAEPAAPAQDAPPPAASTVAAAGELAGLDEARIVEAVMNGLQQRIDLMLDFRLREALAPVLARATDAILREARDELTHTLHDVVTRAVSQELARRRLR